MKPSEYLTDVYVEMIGQLFNDICGEHEIEASHCNIGFMESHGHLMDDYQRKALSAFTAFNEALWNLEDRTESTNENLFRR